MKRMNILFSTTRQWNPGDEFILKGIINIFKSLDVQFNPIIFNRNPEIKHKETDRCFNFQFVMDNFRFKALKPGFYDNSFKKELSAENFIDLAVFAGTSEWASARMKVMYEYIDRYSIPTAYLGIGLGSADFKPENLKKVYKNVIQNAKLIVVRDRVTEKALSVFNAVYLSCPAFLSAPQSLEKKISEVKKIGLIYGSDKSVKANRVDQETHRFMLEFYKKVLSIYKGQFEFNFICHYINELPEFLKDFPGGHCYYSYDSTDYLEIYN
jgi:polysaccharide pyruvyl transferase WcaK-like protein